jgi:CTP synthase
VPFIAAAGEMKTKPTQHSVKELREIGIQPDVVLCRADRALSDGDRRKIALFTNLTPTPSSRRSTPTRIYKIPGALHAEASMRSCARSCTWSPRLPTRRAGTLVDALLHPEHEVNIAMVGKYVDLTSRTSRSPRRSRTPAFTRGAAVNIHYVDSEVVEREGTTGLAAMDAILVPADSASAASKARSVRSATRARTASVSRAYASGCSSP